MVKVIIYDHAIDSNINIYGELFAKLYLDQRTRIKPEFYPEFGSHNPFDLSTLERKLPDFDVLLAHIGVDYHDEKRTKEEVSRVIKIFPNLFPTLRIVLLTGSPEDYLFLEMKE